MVQVMSKYIVKVITLRSQSIILIFMTISPSLSIMIGGSLVFCICLFSDFDLDPLSDNVCCALLSRRRIGRTVRASLSVTAAVGKGAPRTQGDPPHLGTQFWASVWDWNNSILIASLPINSLKWKWWEKKKCAKKNLMKLKRDHNSEADLLESRHTGD